MTPRQIEALCANYHYQVEIQDGDKTIPNPETQEQFAQRMVGGFVADHVKAYEINLVRAKAEADYLANPEGMVMAAKVK